MRPEPIILVADDDEDIRVLLTLELRRAGYQVIAAENGEVALRLAAEHDPDLLLLDVSMPTLGGHELCRAVTSGNPSPPPVIFLSARTQPTERVLGLQAGAVDYMTKPFDAHELRTRVSIALRTKRRMETLERDTAVDALTGLWNRAQLDDRLEEAVARTKRYGGDLACVLLDLDGFKAINDDLGHVAGDDVLRAVSARLRESVRTEDSVFRYGGEEFCILADGSDGQGAMNVAETLLKAIADKPIRGLDITACAGVAAWTVRFDQPTELLEAADTALREAKRWGRAQARLAESLSALRA
jgi:two-component system, cell cycle response regulator